MFGTIWDRVEQFWTDWVSFWRVGITWDTLGSIGWLWETWKQFGIILGLMGTGMITLGQIRIE